MRVVWRLLGVVLLLLVVALGWVGVRGALAAKHLKAAAPLVSQLEQQARAGKTAEVKRTLVALQQQTGPAHRLTSDPVWAATSHVPWVGTELAAVGAVAASADQVAFGTLPPLVGAGLVDPAALAPRGGQINLAPLLRARQPLASAVAASAPAAARVAPYGTGGELSSGLFGALRGPVARAADGIIKLNALLVAANRAARLLP